MQGALERAHENIALGPIVIDDPQPCIAVSVLLRELVALISDVGNLPTHDKEAAYTNLGLHFERTRLPDPLIKLSAYVFEERLE